MTYWEYFVINDQKSYHSIHNNKKITKIVVNSYRDINVSPSEDCDRSHVWALGQNGLKKAIG